MSWFNDVGNSIEKAYDKATGVDKVVEASEAYDKAKNENTGTNGMNKAYTQGQMAASATGANAAQTAKDAASAAGASKGAASALGESAVQSATNDAVAGETEKAAKKNLEIVEAKAKELEEAQSDMEDRNALISQVAAGAGSTIGGIWGPVGSMLGSMAGKGLGMANSAYAKHKVDQKTSDKRLKVYKGINVPDSQMDRCGYKSKVKKRDE